MLRRRFAGADVLQLARRHRRDRHGQIDADRAAGPTAATRSGRPAAACSGTARTRIAGEAARARVHRADQHEARGEGHRARGARDADAAFLERLAQHFERTPAELGHLVEEQHAVVREADLAGPRNLPAADERDVRDRVVRRAERALAQQRRARRRAGRRPSESTSTSSASSNVSGGRIAADPPRHHRLAGAGRTDHQHVVPAGGRNLQRAPRQRLARARRRSRRRCAVAGGTVDGGGGPTLRNASGSLSAATASASDRTRVQVAARRRPRLRRCSHAGSSSAAIPLRAAPPPRSAARRAPAESPPSSDSSPSSSDVVDVAPRDARPTRRARRAQSAGRTTSRPCGGRPARG